MLKDACPNVYVCVCACVWGVCVCVCAASGLAYRPGESIPETQEVRTSTGCFLVAQQDKGGVLGEIERKIAAVTHLPIEVGIMHKARVENT